MSGKLKSAITIIILIVFVAVGNYIFDRIKLPHYAFSLFIIVLLLVLFIIHTIYAFRNSGGIRDIPPDKLIAENEYMEKAIDELKELEFDVVGKYYEGEPQDIIIYVFRHKDDFIMSFLNQSCKKTDKISFHCSSHLSDGYSLITALDLDICPYQDKLIIQTFTNTTYGNVLKWHMVGLDVLKNYGLAPEKLPAEDLIKIISKKHEEKMRELKSNPLLPILVLLSSFTLRKKVMNHRRPVEEQIKKGTLKIHITKNLNPHWRGGSKSRQE